MAIDLTGGLTDDREFVFAEQPDDPEMRESVNTWVWDQGTEFGMPRIGVEAVADQWETHDIQVNLAFANGRVLNIFGPGKVHDPLRRRRQAARSSAPARSSFELIEPFATGAVGSTAWRCRRRSQAQIDGWQAGRERRREPCRSSSSATSGRRCRRGRAAACSRRRATCSPPRRRATSWAARASSSCSATTGTAARRRRGASARRRRRCASAVPASGGSAAFRGHVWQSTVFPSGRAFGLCLYPPRDDGKATFNEGFLFEGDGELIPARVTDAPWLRRWQPKGQDVSVTLETEDGQDARRSRARPRCRRST